MSARPRKIVHIDMDAFFASVEQRDDPQLRAQPVIVGGDPASRGVVCAASYEARVFGVRSAMSSAHAFRLCPHAVFVKPDFSKYKAASTALHAIFHVFTDRIEPLSLDEAFLDVTDNALGIPSATWVAEDIRRRIWADIGLTASAGVSNCKFIAKIASDVNKPNGICVVPPDAIQDFLRDLAVRTVPGIGPVMERTLHGLGIRSIHDLRQLSLTDCVHHFDKQGQHFYNLARGIDLRPVVASHGRRTAISVEHTFSSNVHDLMRISQHLQRLSEELALRLEKSGARSHELCLKVKYGDFTNYTHQTFIHHDMYAANDIYNHAQQLFHESIDAHKDIRLLGLSAGQLDHSGAKQHSFLAPH